MSKVLRMLITFTAIAIVLCIFVAISKLGNAAAPVLLQFAQDHHIALSGATFLMISVAGLFIFKKTRLSR
ncbi:hypothetical protein [Undibacterium sp. Di24W]|uniref:hypothetical protein n=1 Tax=Undibacterium sp. Di24W TaxID=3413033 RepID=UPI003BF3F325